MNVIQSPSGINFAGNICDIIVETTAPILFRLQGGGIKMSKETYTPINGRVIIPLKDLMEQYAVSASINVGVTPLPQYQYLFGDVVFGTFRCLAGGHEAKVDAATFIENNWLTWQPQTRRTTFHAPQRLCYAIVKSDVQRKVKARGYFADKTTAEIDLCTLTGIGIHTIDVTYGAMREKFNKQPLYFDVWVTDNGTTKSYTQRYFLVNDSHHSDIFMWNNTLGGVDTAIFTGELKENNDYSSENAIIGEVERAYKIKNKKVFTKSTGYIETDNERLWVLDFFNSTSRWYLDQGIMREILISSPKLEHIRHDLIGYEFSFSPSKQAKYLNIARIDTPELLEIIDPAGELFFLAPRLLQFKYADTSVAEILIPVQYANSEEWLKLSLSSIFQSITGGTASKDHHHDERYAKKNGDPEQDFVAKKLMAKQVLAEAIEAQSVEAENVTARQKIVAPTIESPIFDAGIIRSGYQIFTDPVTGKSTLSISKIVADELSLDQLTIQRVQAIGGVVVLSQAYAKIVRVENLGSAFRCYYIPEGGVQLWKTGDQALRKDAGKYYWRLVTSVSDAANDDGEHWFNLSTSTADGSAVPATDDEVVLLGHRGDDLDRRSALVLSSGTLGYPNPFTYYENINNFSLVGKENIRFGRDSILKVKSFSILSDDGGEYRVPCERGAWSNGHYSYYDRVSHNGSMWLCIAENGTDVEPSEVADGVWLKQVSQGEQGAKGDTGKNGEKGENGEQGADGKDGQTPIIYELLPSATAVKKDTAGALSPATVNCRVVLRYGKQREVIGVDPKIEFVGRNLLPASDFSDLAKWQISSSLTNHGIIVNGSVFGGKYLFLQNRTSSWYSVSTNIVCRKNTQYIVRCAVNVFFGSNLVQMSIVGNTTLATKNLSATDKFEDVEFIFNSGDNEEVLLKFWTTGASTTNRGYVGISSIVVTIDKTAQSWQPAPEDYAIKLNNEAYTAGTAITPTDTLNWTLHDPSGKEIDRKSTIFSEEIEVGGVNRIFDSRYDSPKNISSSAGVSGLIVDDPKFGKVLQLERVSGSGEFQTNHPKEQLTGQQIVFTIIAKKLSESGSWMFGGWNNTFSKLSSASPKIDLGDGWYLYWATFTSGATLGSTFGINTIVGKWQFYACGMYAGNKPPFSWSPAPEDVQGEIIKAKTDALMALVSNGTSVPDVESFLKSDAPMEIKKNASGAYQTYIRDAVAVRLAALDAFIDALTVKLLKADSAFIRDLVAKRIRTSKGEVDISDTLQKFGVLEVLSDRSVVIKDSEGFSTFAATNTDIPSTAQIGAGAQIGATESINNLNVLDSFSSLKSVRVNYNNTLLTAFGSIKVSSSAITGVGGTATVTGYIIDIDRNGLRVANLGTVTVTGGTMSNPQNKTLTLDDKSILVPPGLYTLAFTVSRGATTGIEIRDAMLSYYYNPGHKMQFGKDGYGYFLCRDSYEHNQIIPTGVRTSPFALKKTFKGTLDYPGVLAKARISSDGAVSKRWGKTISRVSSVSGQTYNKKVTHGIGSSEYTAIVTPVGRGVIAEVINENSSSVDIYSTGAFNIMLIGDN